MDESMDRLRNRSVQRRIISRLTTDVWIHKTLFPSIQITSAFRNVFGLGDGFLVDAHHIIPTSRSRRPHMIWLLFASPLLPNTAPFLAHSSCIFVKQDVLIPDLSLSSPFTYSAFSQVVLYFLIFFFKPLCSKSKESPSETPYPDYPHHVSQ